MMPGVVINVSSSLSAAHMYMDKRDPIGGHFRWSSIKKFFFLAWTYSNSVYNFDIFSKICTTVTVYDFLFLQFAMGTSYIFMDVFIKLYTRRIDATKLLNPLMRGVTYGLFLQTVLWALFHSQYVGDTLRFIYASIQTHPSWYKCGKANVTNVTCIPASDIRYKCKETNVIAINFADTSAHYNYIQSFIQPDRNKLTSRFFALAVVWVINFFFSTVSDDNLLKIFKLALMCRTFSSVVILIFLYFSATSSSRVRAFYDIFSFNRGHSTVGWFTCYMNMRYDGSAKRTCIKVKAATHVAYMYGIGFLGLHDFSSMSVFTMVDNAVIIYTLLFTSTALIRSWVVRVLYLELTSCVKVDNMKETHYLIYAVIPLSTEFFPAHKLYLFYVYINIAFSTAAYLIMLTLTLARILHSEFSSVKNIYLVGILCFCGFAFSLIIASTAPNESRLQGLSTGLDVIVFYLGGIKAALIMWVYGVERFATDIQFWLGFKPTRYWTICWLCLPIILLVYLIRKVYLLSQVSDIRELVAACIWILISVLTVAVFQIKTIAKFVLQNNLANVFSANKRYGPPDPDDRKRRRNFDETIQLRQCKHNCHPIDEMVDCNHLPLMRTLSGQMVLNDDYNSLTNIYENRSTENRKKMSTAMGVT